MSISTLADTQPTKAFRLNDLPYEIKSQVAKFVGKDSYGWGALIDLACVNSQYHEMAIMHMDCFDFDHMAYKAAHKLRNFIENVIRNGGARAVHIKRLHLDVGWQQYAYDFEETEESACMDPADLFGLRAMEIMTNLRELWISYDSNLWFLECGLPPRLQTLVVRSEGREGYDIRYRDYRAYADQVQLAGTVHVNFLRAALQSKSLKKLDLGGQSVFESEVTTVEEDEDSVVKESPIEQLVLRVGNFSDGALLKLLQVPQGLRCLEFTPPRFGDVHRGDEHDDGSITSDAANLPAMSTFGVGLAGQIATLESLTILRGDSNWHPNLDRIGSLAKFRVLQNLNLDYTTLMGWDHCEHYEPHTKRRPTDPSCLPDLLPTSLEFLTLKFEDHHRRTENGVALMIAAAKALKEASVAGQFPNLREVTFNIFSALPYCNNCSGLIPMEEWDWGMPEEMAGPLEDITDLQINEIRYWAWGGLFHLKFDTDSWYESWEEIGGWSNETVVESEDEGDGERERSGQWGNDLRAEPQNELVNEGDD